MSGAATSGDGRHWGDGERDIAKSKVDMTEKAAEAHTDEVGGQGGRRYCRGGDESETWER